MYSIVSRQRNIFEMSWNVTVSQLSSTICHVQSCWYVFFLEEELHNNNNKNIHEKQQERPKEESLVKRWQLACEDDIAHVVVMPNITREKIDVFIQEFVESREKHGARDPTDENSPLSALQRFSWWLILIFVSD